MRLIQDKVDRPALSDAPKDVRLRVARLKLIDFYVGWIDREEAAKRDDGRCSEEQDGEQDREELWPGHSNHGPVSCSS